MANDHHASSSVTTERRDSLGYLRGMAAIQAIGMASVLVGVWADAGLVTMAMVAIGMGLTALLADTVAELHRRRGE